MPIKNHGVWLRYVIVFASLLLAGLVAIPTAAAEDDEELSRRIVLLKVPDGGTEALTAAFEDIDGVEVKQQKWFIKEIKSRGISAKKILRRSKDLRWVIKGAEIRYIVYLKAKDDEKYSVTFIGTSGTPEEEFEVDKTSTGLSDLSVKFIAEKMEGLLGAGKTPVVATLDEIEEPEESEDPSEIRARAKAEEDAIKDRLSRDWFFARVQGRLFKRDLSLNGSNGAVLNYASSFYPGLEAEVEAYPFVLSDPDAAGAGLFANFKMGFATVRAAGEDPNVLQDFSIGHLEVEGGPTYRLVTPLGQEGGTSMLRAQVKLAVRYTGFSVDANRALPSTSMLAIVVGAKVSYPIHEIFALQGFFDVVPMGFWGDNKDFFGASASTYGFATGLGGLVSATKSIGVLVGYQFRLERTSFADEGTLDFVDTEAFELVQGANVGVLYQY